MLAECEIIRWPWVLNLLSKTNQFERIQICKGCKRKKKPSLEYNFFPFAPILPTWFCHFILLSLQSSDCVIARWEKSGSFSLVVRQAASATDGTYAASPPGSDSSRPEGKLLNLVPPKIMSLPWVLCNDASPKESEPPV